TGTPTGPLEDQTGRFGDQTRDRSTATQPSGMRNGQTQRDQRQTGQQQGQPLFEAVEDVTGGQVSSAAAQDDRLTGTWVSEPGQAGTGIYRLDFNKRGDQKIATWTIVPEAGTGANEQALDDQLPLKEGMSAD